MLLCVVVKAEEHIPIQSGRMDALLTRELPLAESPSQLVSAFHLVGGFRWVGRRPFCSHLLCPSDGQRIGRYGGALWFHWYSTYGTSWGMRMCTTWTQLITVAEIRWTKETCWWLERNRRKPPNHMSSSRINRTAAITQEFIPVPYSHRQLLVVFCMPPPFCSCPLPCILIGIQLGVVINLISSSFASWLLSDDLIFLIILFLSVSCQRRSFPPIADLQ